jgi:hypothetical protein
MVSTWGMPDPGAILESLTQSALKTAKKARKQRKALTGVNSYSNTLARLRADATNAFGELSAQSAGDTTALAELIQSVFGASTSPEERAKAAQELVFSLRTTWKQPKGPRLVLVADAPPADQDFFPLSILQQTGRGYISTVGRQMNGCFARGWYDACAVMMRRLIEISIIEAFEHKGIAAKIKSADDNYFHLSGLITAAMREPAFSLSRNTKRLLPQLREFGDLSAHGRYYLARKEDVEKLQTGCRLSVEEFLHHANLLKS